MTTLEKLNLRYGNDLGLYITRLVENIKAHPKSFAIIFHVERGRIEELSGYKVVAVKTSSRAKILPLRPYKKDEDTDNRSKDYVLKKISTG